MLISKVEKIKVNLDNNNIKKYKITCRKFNRKYNGVLSELLTERYSLPTREEGDTLIKEISKLKKEIKNLKSNKKTEDEIFEESILNIKIMNSGKVMHTRDEYLDEYFKIPKA